MKSKQIVKMVLVLIIGMMLIAKPVNVLAALDPTDSWENQGSREDVVPNITTTPETTTPSTTTPSITTPETTTPSTTTPSTNTTNKTDIPKAGLAEDTVMIVAVSSLIIVAVYAFVKISDYKNI